MSPRRHRFGAWMGKFVGSEKCAYEGVVRGVSRWRSDMIWNWCRGCRLLGRAENARVANGRRRGLGRREGKTHKSAFRVAIIEINKTEYV